MLRAVAEQNYTEPTPIQVQAIPCVLAGRDLLAAAQTGTGKTAAFVLPLLQKLATAATAVPRRAPRALVLTPTRELAAQVEESVRAYGKHLPVTAAVVFGGVGFEPQARALARGVDVLVATPGRLLDHVQQKTVDLAHVEILVLDEGDRMLDMGFIRDIRRILALLPKRRQNLLFSATFSTEIRALAASLLSAPAVVEVAPRNSTCELVTQVVYPVDASRKRMLLAHLITAGAWEQVLVFTRTKHGANRLAQQLDRDGIAAQAIHGNKSQSHRTRTLESFKRGDLRVLVATDLAARGLDIEELPHVVNFDLPHVAEDYIHRIGRTGRAGARGEAISLMSSEERPLLGAIERLIQLQIERRTDRSFEAGASKPHPSDRGDDDARDLQRRKPQRAARTGATESPRDKRDRTHANSRSADAERRGVAGGARPGHHHASPGQLSNQPRKRSAKGGPIAALLRGGRAPTS